MIIGGDREAVIENIRLAAEAADFHRKVEIHDPVLSAAQAKAITDRYLAERGRLSFRMKSFIARRLANSLSTLLNRDTEFRLECPEPDLAAGAMFTSNHFGPIENTVIRHYVRRRGKGRLHVVSQVTNLAMTGPIGFLMNYADTIPISQDVRYMQRGFLGVLSERLSRHEVVLIYPEQEMWFNYRKPRPLKRGVYYYAAKLGVPVVCCFVEMVDRPEMDTPAFHKVRYILHILDTMYPDPEKSAKENSIWMCQRDYALKKAAYEKAYGKPLDYAFSPTDIAGWVEGYANES